MPRAATRLKLCTTGGTRRFRTSSIGSPGLLSQRGYISPMLRPSIICISSRAVDLGGAAGADQLAVAQHRDGVADLEHLAEPVGDVDDRLAFGLERAQRVEDALDLDVGQRRGRLVEDEHPRVAGQHPRELDKLAPADAELRHRRVQRQIAEPDLFAAPPARGREIPCGGETAAPRGCRARCCRAPRARARGSAPAPPARCRAPGRAADRKSRSARRRPGRGRRRPDARR